LINTVLPCRKVPDASRKEKEQMNNAAQYYCIGEYHEQVEKKTNLSMLRPENIFIRKMSHNTKTGKSFSSLILCLHYLSEIKQ
jgi:hypothetical protein